MRHELHIKEGVDGIRLGMTRDQVAAQTGPATRSSTDRDIFGDLHVHYDGVARVRAIEVSASLGGEALFDGVDLLGVDAEDALARVRRFASVDTDHWEYPMTCVFPELGLALWRSCLPADDPDGNDGRRFESATIEVSSASR